MKGNDKVIAVLNAFLADELTAISQYIVHSDMCANWQYKKLHEATEKRAIEEMKHAEKLIGRILFLEGKPIVSQLNKISIGGTVEEQLKNDLAAELGAIKAYNEAIKVCLEVGDGGSRELIEDNLEDEEKHLDWLEAQVDQIAQMGLQNYTIYSNPARTESERNWVPFLLLGGGFVQRVGPNAAVYVEVLFDVLQDENSPHEDWDPIISIGGGVGF